MGPEHKRAIYDLKFVDRTIGIPVSDSSQGTKQLRPAICFVRRSAPLGPNSVGTVAANDEAHGKSKEDAENGPVVLLKAKDKLRVR